MDLDTSKIIISILVIVASFVIKLISYRVLNGVIRKIGFKLSRKVVFDKIINILLILIASIILLGIWEVDSNDLTFYFASVFTILGIAFFAQWSHLSNVTAGVIILFNHPARIGDLITINDGDNSVTGQIEDIGLFFITVISPNKNKVLLANTLFLQKSVSVNAFKESRKGRTKQIPVQN